MHAAPLLLLHVLMLLLLWVHATPMAHVLLLLHVLLVVVLLLLLLWCRQCQHIIAPVRADTSRQQNKKCDTKV